MKKILLVCLVFASSALFAQTNLQVHYDLHGDRGYLTTTMEMFKPDNLGNTFFFIDMDYGSNDVDGISLAYWEIARVIKTKKMPVGLHVEYNGGFGTAGKNRAISYRINDAWLAGVDYSWNAKDYSKGVTAKVLFKHIRDKHDASFQLTGVWYWHFLNRKLTFTGFMDFWREDVDVNFDGVRDASFIFLTEPQLWYNFCENFSVGGEVEISNYFANMEGLHVFPTVGAKWTF